MSKKLDNLERLKIVRRTIGDLEREQHELIWSVYRNGDTVTWTRTNRGRSFVQVGTVTGTAYDRVRVRNADTKREFWLNVSWLLND